jgi:ABC-type transport system involved in multi-copper enzyme maturation permease subunit
MRDRDLSDLLSPILVKEVRQGVRGQVFSGSCLLLQVLMLVVMAAALAEPGRSRGSAEMLMVWFWLTLGLPVAVIQPLSGIAAVSGERVQRTLEPMLLTGLSARRIVRGKWTALAVQNLLLLTAAFPFFLLRYFLGGVDLAAEMLWMLGLCLFAGLLTALTVGLSPQPVASLVRMVLYCASIGSAISLVVPFVAGAMQPMLASRATPLVVSAALSTVAALLALEAGAQQIAAPAEQTTTRLRLIVLGVLPVAAWGARHLERWLQPHVVFWTVTMLTLVALSALCETPKASTRASAFFGRGRGRAALGVFFAAGWPSGVFFTLALVAVACATAGYAGATVGQAWAGLAIAAGLLIPVPILTLPWLRGRRRGQIYIATQLLLALVGTMAPLLGALGSKGAEWLGGHALLASPIVYLLARLADAKLPSPWLFGLEHVAIIAAAAVVALPALFESVPERRRPDAPATVADAHGDERASA